MKDDLRVLQEIGIEVSAEAKNKQMEAKKEENILKNAKLMPRRVTVGEGYLNSKFIATLQKAPSSGMVESNLSSSEDVSKTKRRSKSFDKIDHKSTFPHKPLFFPNNKRN